MSDQLAALIAQARSLSPEERELLMLQLQQMLDETAEPGWESAWSAEIERRIEAYERGEVTTSSWEEVRARLWAKYPRR